MLQPRCLPSGFSIARVLESIIIETSEIRVVVYTMYTHECVINRVGVRVRSTTVCVCYLHLRKEG